MRTDMAHPCIPHTLETEAEGSAYIVQGQPELFIKICLCDKK